MTSPPQAPVSVLQRLPDELLQDILFLAMTRDSPVYIDDRHLGYMDGKSGRKSSLTSSTGATDSLFLGEGMRTPEGPFYADHQHDPQSVHRADWLAINSTNRRIRTVGKPCFFGAKTIAMRAELPIRLQLKDYQAKNRMSSSDQALAFMYARDIVLVNTSNISPSHLLGLPKLFTRFPCLRRCMLLFGWDEVCDDVEWISCAFVLGEPVGDEVKELMVAVGMERNMVCGIQMLMR